MVFKVVLKFIILIFQLFNPIRCPDTNNNGYGKKNNCQIPMCFSKFNLLYKQNKLFYVILKANNDNFRLISEYLINL